MEARRIGRLGLAVSLFALVLPAAVRSQPADAPGVPLPVPDEAQRAEALALVREVYREQFDQARTAPGKVVLARMLLKQAAVATEAAAGRFVLMDLARAIATEAGDLELSLRAIDDLETTFAIDRLAMADRTLDQIARHPQTNQQGAVAAQVATGLADEAVADDRYQLARHLGQTALSAARNAGDDMLVKQVVAKNREVEQAERDYRVVQQALAVLARTPADVAANLAVGKHDCFVKGDWPKGLPKLASTNDPVLGPLVEMELKAPLSTDEQIELADRWFASSRDEESREQRSFQARAAFWYQSALPKLTGLMKLKAEKRLEELADAMAATIVEASPASGQENRSVRLPVTARIVGSDTLEVFSTHARWTHGVGDWPRSLVFSGVAWSPRRGPVMPFDAAIKRRLSHVDFRSAELVQIRGRNDVRLENAGDHVTIRFSDGAPGAGVYEVVVDLPWKTD